MCRLRAISSSVLLAGMLGVALRAETALAGGANTQSKPIEFSTPKDGDAALLKPVRSADTSKPLLDNPFNNSGTALPDSSLRGTVMPLPVPSQSTSGGNQRMRELMDKRRENQRNWVFADPNEMLLGTTAEQILGVADLSSDSKAKEDMSPLERYTQRKLDEQKEALLQSRKSYLDSRQDQDDDKVGPIKKATLEMLLGRLNEAPDKALPLPSASDISPDRNDGNSPYNINYNAYVNYRSRLSSADTEQQQRQNDFKKLIGLAVEADPTRSQLNPWAPVLDTKLPKTAVTDGGALTGFTTAKPKSADELATVGFMAPLAPTAPSKPTINPVITTVDSTVEKQNARFFNQGFSIPERRFQ